MLRLVLTCFLFICLTGCISSLWGGDGTPEVVTKDDEILALESKLDAVLEALKNQKEKDDLERARIWARLEELNKKYRQYRDQSALNDRFSAMGFGKERVEIRPSAPVMQLPDTGTAISTAEGAVDSVDKSEPGDAPAIPASPVSQKRSQSKDQFLLEMEAAKEVFKEGKYGKALVHFEKIENSFGDSIVRGRAQYWKSMCWYHLKEYSASKNGFQEFMKRYPLSPWVASASYQMALVDLKLGLRDSAVKRLQEVIRTHPYEGTAEAARQLLANLNRAM